MHHDPTLSSFNQLFRNYRDRAKKNGRKFTLTRECFRKLTQSPCYYCGSGPRQYYRRTTKRQRAYRYNGIDRFDNAEGYTEPNSVPCCWQCNEWKRAMPAEKFLAHIARIATYAITSFRLGRIRNVS